MLKQMKNFHAKYIRLLAAICAGGLLCTSALYPKAASDKELLLEHNRSLPIQSNEVADWPTGPVVGAESAILMEAETGTILYAKNIHQHQYPASTTKILTTLIVSEQCTDLDEIISFSHDAVFDTPRDSSHIAMDVGQELTLEQCLNAMLIRSANEVCYALAEHITGTTDWSVFAEIMNQRAQELGCVDSHFANPNGLPDENHYSSVYDLAMIGRAFFDNEMLCRITLTRRMEFPATEKLPQGKLEINNMKIIPGGEYAYEYIVGCKTGFTDDARYCLVSCAEKDGMRLICAVMHDEEPYQYEDSIALFEYGFSNFEKVNVSQTETRYNIDDTGLFYSGNDIFGSSRSFLSLNKDDFIILPKTASFSDAQSSISYETEHENQAAVINYSYHGVDIGSARVNFTADKEENDIFAAFPETDLIEEDSDSPVIFINTLGIRIVLGVLGAVFLIWLILQILRRYFAFSRRKRRRRRGARSRRRSANFRQFRD